MFGIYARSFMVATRQSDGTNDALKLITTKATPRPNLTHRLRTMFKAAPTKRHAGL